MNKSLDENKSKSTKEKILEVSIQEFALKGYDNASIRKIAELVGIKGSSIYNHFHSKEAILEEIFKYYRNTFYQDVVEFEVNNVNENKIPDMLKQGLYSVVDTFKKPEITNIIKIIIKEQFKNKKIREFFLEEFIEMPRNFMVRFMELLMNKEIIKEGNPHLLSQEFHAFPIYKMYEGFMLNDMKDMDFDDLQRQINEHIDFFWSSIRK